MRKVFTLTACVGVLGISWTGLPLAVNYFSISLIIVSSIYFGFPKSGGKKLSATGPLILVIALSTFVDIFLIQERMRESFGRRLIYIQEVIPIYSGNLFTTDVGLFITNDLIGMCKWICALLFMPFLFGFNSSRPQIRIDYVLKSWVAAVSLSVFVAILNSFGIVLNFVTNDVSEEIGANRFSGLSSHPNHLATLISMTLPIALYTLKNSGIPKLNFLMVPFFFFGQMLTGSRIGLVSFTLSLLLSVTFVLGVRVSMLFWLAAIFIFFAIYVLPYFSIGPDLSSSRLFNSGEGVSQSNKARLALARQGLADFLGNPILGIGPRAFKSSHNIFLQLLASLGLLGFFAFIFLLRKSLGKSKYDDVLMNALRISIMSILVTGLFSNGLADFFIYLPFGAILGTISQRRRFTEGILR